jgi:GMP synthase (glutamine-hydrolysing)
MTKPFLILQLRSNDLASNSEFEAFLKFGALRKDQVHRVRMESEPFPEIDLDNYAGVIIGGGESNVSDDISIKPARQIVFESHLLSLLKDIYERDFPFLGACYGLGIFGKFLGVDVSKACFSEEAGGGTILLTEAGKADPLMQGVPDQFRAFLGHKESWQELPEAVELLASTDTCPVHMIKAKQNIYATQFHPELDIAGVILRIRIYKNAGYFNPDTAEDLIETVSKEHIIYPMMVLRNFVERYK